MPEQTELDHHSLFGDRFTVRCAVTLDAPADGDHQDADGDRQEDGPRTMTAVLAEYGKTVHPSSYFPAVRLAKGALALPADLNDVKLLRDHDASRVIGAMTAATGMDAAPRARFRFARTADAADALSLVDDGILTHVSVGYRIRDGREVMEDGQTVFEVTAADLFEVSLLGAPADSAARITAHQKGTPMPTNPAPDAPQPPAAPPPAPAAPETPEALQGLSAEQMSAVLDTVRAQLAPAAAAPLTAPALGDHRPQLVDENGNPIVVRARDRQDERIPTALGRNGVRYSAGDYFAAYARGVREGDWTRHNEIRAALQDELTSDIPGMLPTAIIGELLGRASGRRPAWDSLTARDMPMAGEKFSRPKITQHVDVNTQATQKTVVASQKYKVTLEDVSKQTLAGALDVAQQALDWSSPSLLNELIIDFTRLYIARTDFVAAAAIIAAATGTAVSWDGSAAKLNEALATAAGAVFDEAATEEMDVFPNTVWLSVDMWVKLAALTDSTGRPLLPYLSPANASGQIDLARPDRGVLNSPFSWVVDKNFADGTMIVGDRSLTESYENGRRFLQAVRPDVLGLDLAYMGYVATYFPYPKTLVPIKVTPPSGGGAAKSG
ncbi:HK97 family phage prohead protease [Streptomyces alboflavus]|uniref:HK97 family phage prohead protease n=1 Tax=Streptomyces alboflavus TaxID=67267 RepID=UPI00369952BF